MNKPGSNESPGVGKRYAQIVVSVAHKDVDKFFYYQIPEAFSPRLQIGSGVTVPFGRGNRHVEGFVTGFSESVPFDEKKAKSIEAVHDEKPFFTAELLKLAKWMQDKYYATLADCLKCVMPTGMQLRNDAIVTLCGEAAAMKLSPTARKLAEWLAENQGKALLSEIENVFGDGVSKTLKSLSEKGAVMASPVSEFKDLSLKVLFAYANTGSDAFEEAADTLLAGNSPQARALRMIIETDGVAVSDLKKHLNISVSPVKTLEKNGLIITEAVEVVRNTVDYGRQDQSAAKPELTQDQQSALSFIVNKKDNKPVLIHGVTGSGKTEIYMRLIERTIAAGRQAIMLVPEISLTPQTVSVFLNRFGDAVSVTHSRLTLGERYDQWKKARDGRAKIMIGPRSALFMPFERLGVIIIDEEHEKTYQSETTPKYSAREVAVKRGELSGALVILGSATPSLETYHAAETGRYDLITITERINKSLPDIAVVDMRRELVEGNTSIFSSALYDAMKENLAKGEQIILFLNRRGYSTFVSCRKCGYVLACEDCNVNYTYHLQTNRLLCHYCGKKAKAPETCPQCESKYIKFFGVGTQKIEAEVKKRFPEATVLRMDMDTTSGKHMHERLLEAFRKGDAQVLIGTQMIAKGLDFPNVSLVGIVAADLSLNTGDFRAGETTYQLLTQVSGRAGRARILGRVVIQTYSPDHYSIVYARENDYQSFYGHEIAIRRQMNYPPFSHLFTVLLTGEQEKPIITALFALLEIMKHYNRKGQFDILGPSPAVISKIRKRYRWKLIVKAEDEEKLKSFVLYCLEKLKGRQDCAGLYFNLTLNPLLIV